MNRNKETNPFVSAEEAISAYGRGEMLILVDDEDRENEGDLVIAAEYADAEQLNFMARNACGLICLSITAERALELELPPMVTSNTALLQTAFTISVDAVENTTTGISAYDRAVTIAKLLDPAAQPQDLARPGHVFPLIAHPQGVLGRPGHTEAVIDLARAAHLYPAGVLCEILSRDGSMARLPELQWMAGNFNLKLARVQDLVDYRRRMESLIKRQSSVYLPTDFGDFQLSLYHSRINQQEYHLALVKGDLAAGPPVLTRVHSECLTGDIFGSHRCDCGPQLELALRQIESEGRGVLIYMRQEGRGIGLPAKLLAYQLQEQGMDTVEANEHLGYKPDQREYWFAAQILRELNVKTIKLMTNNPAKVAALQHFGIEISERIEHIVRGQSENAGYLDTKQHKMGHLLHRQRELIDK